MARNNRTTDSASPDKVEIRNYPSSLIYEHVSPDGSIFRSLSFRFKNSWASLFLPENSTSQSIMRNGNPISGRVNIDLGEPDRVQNVSVQQDDASFKRVPMFNKTILSAISESRQDYLRSIAV